MNKIDNKTRAAILTLALLVAAIGVFFYKNSMQKQKQTAADKVQSVTQENKDIVVKIGKDIIKIQPCVDNILRIHYLPQGKESDPTLILDKKDWSKVDAKIDLNANPVVIKTDKMTIDVNKTNGSITVLDSNGKVLLNNIVLNGSSSESQNGAVNFNIEKGQKLYGLSGYSIKDSVKGILRDDASYDIKAGEQGYAGGPFVWSTSGYGFLIDTDGGKYSIDNNKVSFDNCSRTDKEAYVMVGKPEEIMAGLSQVTGKTTMFPKWAMGFTNSEWGLNETELLNIVDTYRKKNIPIDNYTLDFDWKCWGQDNYGEFRWNSANFPDGASGKLAKLLKAEGIKLTAIMKPRIHVDTVEGKFVTNKNWWLEQKGTSQDYFSKKLVGDLDFSKEDARKWFFNNCKSAMASGIVGWWNDEADADSPNLQFLNMQRALYEGQREQGNQRVWSLNRNFYIGAQRYAYGMWSGDINTGFQPMQAQRDVMLSAINLGETKWGMDTGGFFGSKVDPENYARWMEFSAFTPIFRVHGQQGQQRQPWVYGEKAESAAVKAIKTRYSLIPYIYSYERRAYEGGVGVVKPLIFDYPNDEKAANYVDGWMFGDYMYVSPVLEQGADSEEIYLPQGTWYDYERGTKYQGNQTIKYQLTKGSWDDIPVLIKEGAIIPSQDVMNYIGEKPVENIYVDVFPSANKTEFKYYDDDGETYNYEKGQYFSQVITQSIDKKPVISISAPEGSFKPETKYYIFKIHENLDGDLSINGSSLKSVGSYDDLLNEQQQCFAKGSDKYGTVTYVKVKFGQKIEIK